MHDTNIKIKTSNPTKPHAAKWAHDFLLIEHMNHGGGGDGNNLFMLLINFELRN